MGSPGRLRPLPLISHAASSDDLIKIDWSAIKALILNKIEESRIELVQLSVTRRSFPEVAPTAQDLTILIVANEQRENSWVIFLDSLLEVFKGLGLGGLLMEIIHPSAVDGLSTFAVPANHPIINDWVTLRPKVLAELDLKYQWNSLSVCNRGYNISGLHSSTTVVISCEDISNPIWTYVKVKVTELLDQLNYEVRVEVVQTRMSRNLEKLPSMSLSAAAF
jgi:hypothetical protein